MILNWLFANFQYFYIDNLCGPQIFLYKKRTWRLLKKEITSEHWLCTLIKTLRLYPKLSFLDKCS
jgi:hypothetical protein